MTTHRYLCKQQPVLHADGQKFPSLKSRTPSAPTPPEFKKKRKKKNENKENTLDWMHRRAPVAPALRADLSNLVNLDLFRSHIMEE